MLRAATKRAISFQYQISDDYHKQDKEWEEHVPSYIIEYGKVNDRDVISQIENLKIRKFVPNLTWDDPHACRFRLGALRVLQG